MTDYGLMARRHWVRWLPARYSRIPDPARFFADLGREVSAEIEELALELEGPDRPGETYLDRVGRMSAARARAAEIVVSERILLPPEPDLDPSEEPRPRQQQAAASSAGELPLVVAPGDPLWEEILEQEERARATLRRGPSGR